MAQRILELIFRHKFLLALPMILGISGGVFALSGSDSFYSSRAGIWVERPTDLTGEAFTEFNPYASPAQNQAESMRELLLVDAFSTRILDRINEGRAEGLSMGELKYGTFIYPGSTHLLYVEHHSSNPELAKRTVEEVVAEYASLYTTQIKDRATRAKAFYEEQLNTARGPLETASIELRNYVTRTPQLANVNLDDPPSSALRDFEFARLAAAEETARQNYEQLLQQYANSQISASSAEGTIPNFLVLDKPGLPTIAIQPSKRSLLLPPLFGLAIGVFVSAIAFGIYWRLDRRIHLPDDLAFLAAAIPVMTLPAVKSRRRAWPSKFVRIAAALQNGLRQPSPAAVTE
jgi:uncharacterized protein involved in exopolysaccharide biosynthesis